MKTALLVIGGIYAIGAIAMTIYTRGNVRLGVLWPITLLWFFFGNIG